MLASHYRTYQGFSFIELLIVMVIIGILAAIVYPTYTRYIIKTHRVDAQIALLDLAHRMERYYDQYHTYKGATLRLINADRVSRSGYYLLDIPASHLGYRTYLLRAIPQLEQINDTVCGTLSLDQNGKKEITGTGKVQQCW